MRDTQTVGSFRGAVTSSSHGVGREEEDHGHNPNDFDDIASHLFQFRSAKNGDRVFRIATVQKCPPQFLPRPSLTQPLAMHKKAYTFCCFINRTPSTDLVSVC